MLNKYFCDRSPGENKQFSFFVSRAAVAKVCQNILKPTAPHQTISFAEKGEHFIERCHPTLSLKKIKKDNVRWI